MRHRDEKLDEAVAALVARAARASPHFDSALTTVEGGPGNLLALSADAPELLDARVDRDERASASAPSDQPKRAPVTIQLCW